MFWRALLLMALSVEAGAPYLAEQLWLAQGYIEEGSYVAALHEARQVLRSDPANFDAWLIEQEAKKFLVN